MSDSALPFGREEHLDKPGIVGARWWQRSLEAAPDAASRRKAMQTLMIAGGVLAGVGMLCVVAGAAGSSSDDYRYESRPALDMQKDYGWSFGANAEPLTFDGAVKRPFDREALGRLAYELGPSRPEHVRFYVPTLFQSPTAVQRIVPREETTPPTPLKQALTPIFTPAMDTAYRKGRALAALFKGTPLVATGDAPRSSAAMVVVDLPGPESVAFAAGAASVFDPVFTFDNWPHPRGVVPAHQTLAAAAYFQPLFARHAAGPAAPLLVLDRRRLSAYTDDASQFDNRHLAKVPPVAALRQLGITRVLYVAPLGTDKELDDLNDDFVLYGRSGIQVKLVGADAFGPDATDGAGPPSGPDDDRPYHYYGGRLASNGWFWRDYPWLDLPADPPGKGPIAPGVPPAGRGYAPVMRATPFSGSNTTARARPSGFGTVAVVVSISTGLLLGAKLFRSGSWNRSSGGWGG